MTTEVTNKIFDKLCNRWVVRLGLSEKIFTFQFKDNLAGDRVLNGRYLHDNGIGSYIQIQSGRDFHDTRSTIVHELVHCILNGLDRNFEDVLNGFVKPKASRKFAISRYEDSLEESVTMLVKIFCRIEDFNDDDLIENDEPNR